MSRPTCSRAPCTPLRIARLRLRSRLQVSHLRNAGVVTPKVDCEGGVGRLRPGGRILRHARDPKVLRGFSTFTPTPGLCFE
eukprot:1937518-Alexandrium_andersonii.AAC.1